MNGAGSQRGNGTGQTVGCGAEIHSNGDEQQMTGTKLEKQSALGMAVSGTPEKGQNVTVKSEDALEEIFGTDHPEMAEGLLRHCFKALGKSEISDKFSGNDERMFMVTIIAELAPQDTVERMLAVQMAATHVAMVRAGGYLANANLTQQIAAHNSTFNKLARTFTAQMEALRKHRNGGKQTVTVQHVNVEGGGQAIVGNVQTGEGRK